MSENKDKSMKKKTLSLKLGTKPIISPKKNIEAGKTVIVEKKRYKRSTGIETQSQIQSAKKKNTIENSLQENNETSINKSGVVLKPLSKDEQKRIHKNFDGPLKHLSEMILLDKYDKDGFDSKEEYRKVRKNISRRLLSTNKEVFPTIPEGNQSSFAVSIISPSVSRLFSEGFRS